MPGRDQRDAGSWPCQTHEGRAVHPGLFLRKQLDKRRTFILDVGKLVLGTVSTPAPSLGPTQHTGTAHNLPCTLAARLLASPCLLMPLLPPSDPVTPADPSASPYTCYYLGQASTDTSSTLWEINYPPCRWKSYAMASWWRYSPHLADHGL